MYVYICMLYARLCVCVGVYVIIYFIVWVVVCVVVRVCVCWCVSIYLCECVIHFLINPFLNFVYRIVRLSAFLCICLSVPRIIIRKATLSWCRFLSPKCVFFYVMLAIDGNTIFHQRQNPVIQ